MKIALVASIEESVPPKKYGGTEWIVYHLAHNLGKRGHTVDLYATGDSDKEEYYRLIPIEPKSIRSQPDTYTDLKLRESKKIYAIGQTLEYLLQTGYDVIHNHASWRLLSFANLFKTPILTTHHSPLSIPYQNYVYEKCKTLPHVSISNNQRHDLPTLNFVATIYNGIDIVHFPYSDNNIQDDLLYLARLSPDKGIFDAVGAVKQSGKKFMVAAKVDKIDEVNFERFKHETQGVSTIEFVGEISPEPRLRYLQQARGLLVPIKWEEPFGLMFTESMAVGTPVITYARGAAPEIVVDGVTGFLVNESEENKRGEWIVKKTGVEGLVEAINRLYSLSAEEYAKMRQVSRKHVEDHFTVEKMVDGYEEVYKNIVNS